MRGFLTPLTLEYLDGRIWRVLTEFDFASAELERIVRVPAGFLTDFASTPRILWPLFPPTGWYGKAALIHDRLYRTPAIGCTRASADATLREGMIVLAGPRVDRLCIYTAVRVFGRRAFLARA